MTRKHFALVVVLLVSLWLPMSATPAAGCTCEVQSSVRHAARADVVFTGRLKEIDEPVGGLTRSSMDPVTYRFEVERVFKGAVPQNASVVSAGDGASCGLEGMNVGSRYTIFAQTDAGSLRSGLCGGTHAGDPDPAVALMSGLVLPPVAGAPPGWVFVLAALAVLLLIVVTGQMVRRLRKRSRTSP
jgi:hypothetical protein